MRKLILTFAAMLATAFNSMAGTTGSILIPDGAEAVTVGGDEYWKVEDMLFKREQGFGACEGNSVILWPNGVVYYQFSEDPEMIAKYGAITEEMRGIWRAGAESWTRVAQVRFEEGTGDGTHYLIVYNGGNNSAVVGMGTTPTSISLCDWQRAASHEIGHCLGLGHEQIRIDRDNYVVISDPSKCNAIDSNIQTPYDFESIMHYGPIGWGFTIQCLPQYSKYQDIIGQNKFTTALDNLGLAKMYGMKPTTCDMTFTASPAGQGVVTYSENTTGLTPWSQFQVSVTPKDDSLEFDRWVSDPLGAVHFDDCWSLSTTATVAFSGTIIAKFKTDEPPPPPPPDVTYTVAFNMAGTGTIDGVLSQTVKAGGSTTAIMAIPGEDHIFDNWAFSDGRTSTDNPIVITGVASDLTVRTVFKWDPAKIIDDPAYFKMLSFTIKLTESSGSGAFKMYSGAWFDPASVTLNGESVPAVNGKSGKSVLVKISGADSFPKGFVDQYQMTAALSIIGNGIYRATSSSVTEKTVWKMKSTTMSRIVGMTGNFKFSNSAIVNTVTITGSGSMANPNTITINGVTYTVTSFKSTNSKWTLKASSQNALDLDDGALAVGIGSTQGSVAASFTRTITGR